MRTHAIRNALLFAAVAGCLATVDSAMSADAAPSLPLFDAHLHYNWEPKPRLPLPQVIQLFETTGVTGILANSRPNDGTRALVEARPAKVRVVPFIRPYRIRADIQTWFSDRATLDLIETEFARGYYVGIGEFHLHGKDAENEVVKQVVAFAKAKRIYLHAHSDVEALEILFRHDPAARIVWAHTGFSTPAAAVERVLKRYPGVTAELSYRSGITADGGKLTPEWRALFERYSDRFLLGSDTWIDARWDSYRDIIDGYRVWLTQLPANVAENIAWKNGERLFGKPAR